MSVDSPPLAVSPPDFGPPVRIGLVGCGRLAELGYVPTAAGLAEVEIAAVADPSEARRERVAALLSRPATARQADRIGEVSTHESAAALLADAEVEALVVASPASEHADDAERAGAAGIPCLIEKPPAPDLAGAKRIAALDSPPWIGFNRRFRHAARLLAEVPEAGPLELELELRYRRDSWRPHSVADDALLDLAPHLIDLTLLLTGSEQAEVAAVAIGAERAQLTLATARGPATVRCATDRAYRERIAVGRHGRRIATSNDGGPARALAGRVPGTAHPLVRSLRDQLAAFAGAVRGQDPGLLASAEDGVRVMAVIEAARELAMRAAAPGQ